MEGEAFYKPTIASVIRGSIMCITNLLLLWSDSVIIISITRRGVKRLERPTISSTSLKSDCVQL